MHETTALWHDMKKHLIVVKSLVDNEGNVEPKEYISELESHINEIPTIVRTTQPIVSALLTEELRKARKENITLKLDIQLEKELKINAVDLCVPLGNIFDNAFEACCQLDTYKKRYIDIYLAQKGSAIFIEVKNPYEPPQKKYRRIRKIVEKYGGNIDINSEDNLYRITVFTP